mmetsp:Transcript_26404/g.63373  ORF Transcript_26404/g.63373 Transcript_26404/m.63373 type:complete len:87 (-) Transcript_26404:3115-3375(-)
MLAPAQASMALWKAFLLGPLIASINKYTGFALNDPSFVRRAKYFKHWSKGEVETELRHCQEKCEQVQASHKERNDHLHLCPTLRMT